MNGELIRIHNAEVRQITYRGMPVITLEMMDHIHERKLGTAQRNFTTHQSRLVEGEDYFRLTYQQLDEIRIVDNPSPNGLTLLTESGYLMLVKSFRDDLAWQVQKELVGRYFRTQSLAAPTVKNPAHQMLIDAIVRLDEVEQRAITAETEARQAKDLALQAYQEAQMQTVAEFVFFNKLQHQLPESEHVRFGKHLSRYCLEHGIPVRDIAVAGKRWKTERAYPSPVIHQLLWPWLHSREEGFEWNLKDLEE